MSAVVMLVVAAALQSAGRAVWVDAESGEATTCLAAVDGWTCPNRSEAARGILVVVDPDSVTIAGANGVENVDPVSAAWGRVVRVVAGGAAESDLHDLTLTASKPARSSVRPQLRRFQSARDDAVHVLKLSATVFWVSGTSTVDSDAFLSLTGPDIGSVRLSTPQLREDAPEVARLVDAPLPVTLIGRARNARGEDAAAAVIDLFQPLSADPTRRLDAETPVVARGSTVADETGAFRFERVGETPMLLVASSSTDGRGMSWVTSLGPPAAIDLVPPVKARGRVVRHGLGVAGARIRFVPAAEAWASSADPAQNLTAEVVTGDDGRFEIALPERSSGDLQAVTADGLTARVPIGSSPRASRAIDVGNLTIPDPRRVLVRLLEPLQPRPCDIVAVGPMGGLGLQMVRASSPVNIYTLDLPESGQWVLSADCGGASRTLVPMIATVVPAESDANVLTIDIRFAR